MATKVHLMQIFSNLLSNAIKYTQEGGIIHFIAEEKVRQTLLHMENIIL